MSKASKVSKTSKVSKASKTSKASKAPAVKAKKASKTSKAPAAKKASKTSKAPAAKKASKAPVAKKTSKAPAAKKASKAPAAKKTSKTSKAPAAKKTSKAPAAKTSKAPKASKSLFEQLGGHPAVDAAVDVFYRRVLADARIARFFEDVDMDAQREKQKAFLTMVFGGPSDYQGKDLRAAHARLVEEGLDDGHFDAVAEHLQATLQRLEVPEPLIGQVMAIAGGTRGDVLNR